MAAPQFNPPPPDGGLAWLVCLGTCMVNAITVGLRATNGVLFPAILEEFETNYSEVQLLDGLANCFMFSLAPISNALAHRWGARVLCMAGTVVSSLGLLLSAIVPSINWLIFVYGVVYGVGVGMAVGPSMVILGEYFEKKRAVATAIAAAGVSVGTIFIPHLLTFLEEQFTLRGCYLLIAGVNLQVLPFVALFQPLRDYWKQHPKSAKRLERGGSENSVVVLDDEVKEVDRSDREESPKSESEMIQRTTGEQEKEKEEEKEQSCCNVTFFGSLFCKFKATDSRDAMFDMSICKSAVFLLLVANQFIAIFSFIYGITVLPSRMAENGVPRLITDLILSLYGVCGWISCLVIGCIVDRGFISATLTLGIVETLMGVFLMISVLFHTSAHFWLYACVFGALGPLIYSVSPPTLVEVLGIEKLHSSLGLVYLSGGLSFVTLSFPIGLLRDVTGSFRLPLLVTGGSVATFGMLILLQFVFNRCRNVMSKRSYAV